MLRCNVLISVMCFYLISQWSRVDFVHVEDPISPKAHTDPQMLIPEIKIVRALDVWNHIEIPIQPLFVKYLDTCIRLWTIRVAMRETSPSSAARGVRILRSEDANNKTPTTRFVPTLPARYPLRASVSIMP